MTPDGRVAAYFFVYASILLYLSIGAATLPQLDWYGSLTLPSVVLPPLFVSIAWLIVFVTGAISLATYWKHEPRSTKFPWLVAWYGALSVLLVLWNYVFFGAHLLTSSVWIAGGISVAVTALLLQVRRESRQAALYLLPFLVWMLYATYITHLLTVLNPV